MKKQGHIIVEETVTSFTKEKQEVKSIPRKWIVMDLENSGKKRVFIFSQNTIGV